MLMKNCLYYNATFISNGALCRFLLLTAENAVLVSARMFFCDMHPFAFERKLYYNLSQISQYNCHKI